jgi:hypothetical protein
LVRFGIPTQNAHLSSFAYLAATSSSYAHPVIFENALANDDQAVSTAIYAQMVEDGLLFDDAEPFDELLDHCRELQERANCPARATIRSSAIDGALHSLRDTV